MAPKDIKKIPDKLTDSEKKKIKQENKAKANPERAAEKKEKNDAKRETRKVSAHSPRNHSRLTRTLRALQCRPPVLWVAGRKRHVLSGTAPRSVAGGPRHQCGVLT